MDCLNETQVETERVRVRLGNIVFIQWISMAFRIGSAQRPEAEQPNDDE